MYQGVSDVRVKKNCLCVAFYVFPIIYKPMSHLNFYDKNPAIEYKSLMMRIQLSYICLLCDKKVKPPMYSLASTCRYSISWSQLIFIAASGNIVSLYIKKCT